MEGHSKLYTLLLSAWFPIAKTFKPSFRVKKISFKSQIFFWAEPFSVKETNTETRLSHNVGYIVKPDG